MAVLIITPDMTIDTLLGAAGCAKGSQRCKGKIPALIPKPMSTRKNTIFLHIAGITSPAYLKLSKSNVHVFTYENIMKKATEINTAQI